MTHTPGPWSCVTRSDDTLQVIGGMPLPIICDCWHADGEDVANARLIAAAPDLLEALEQVLMLARLKWGNLDTDANTVFDTANAAIKRAKGGE